MNAFEVAEATFLEYWPRIGDAFEADVLKLDGTLKVDPQPERFMGVHEVAALKVAEALFAALFDPGNICWLEGDFPDEFMSAGCKHLMARFAYEEQKHKIIKPDWIDVGSIAIAETFRARSIELFSTYKGGSA